MFDPWRGFTERKLSDEWHGKLTEAARQARGHILKMTAVAGSGHPGGSMSSLEIFLALYHLANVDPRQPGRDDRDRIIVSHGHTSPGVYAALASVGFFDIYPVLYSFRLGGSPFEGHVERTVPGVEWDTGNLGQGLSGAVGKAIYANLAGLNFHTYVVMGDGEQQKGQIAEARRLAVKYGLTKLTAIVDCNGLQISGKTDDVMPQRIAEGWQADGWEVLEIDGHDLHQVYDALRRATHEADRPTVILARTVMGKGVSFMENDESYHGAAVKPDMIGKALEELGGIENDIEVLRAKRREGPPPAFTGNERAYPEVIPGEPITYGADEKRDNRGAWGKALLSVAEANMHRDGFTMAVFDNDPQKTNQRIGGFSIQPLEALGKVIANFDVGIAIITVPKEAAQGVCDLVVEQRIKAIWNFAPTQLSAPADVTIRNENMAVGLALLSHYLKKRTAESAIFA